MLDSSKLSHNLIFVPHASSPCKKIPLCARTHLIIALTRQHISTQHHDDWWDFNSLSLFATHQYCFFVGQ